MNYPASLRYLNSFINLERITFEPDNCLWNLQRMRLLLDGFGHPEKNYLAILIAGTKGKGSTGYFLESILRAARIRSGFYSSPHLEDPRERIRIQGRRMRASEWAEGVQEIRRCLGRWKLPSSLGDFTYFEILTLLAALAFKKAGVKLGIFEVGMGGRLDATRVLGPKIVLLTPIHLDHEEILGNTIAKIAREKAAVIRRGIEVVSGRQPREAMIEIKRFVRRQRAHLRQVRPVAFSVGLEGDFQRVNAGIAAKGAEILRDQFNFRVTPKAIRKGLQGREWPGRLELFHGSPDILLDGAHNPISIEALVHYLRKHYSARRPLLIFGTSREKKSEKMLQTLGAFFKDIVITASQNPRSQEIQVLMTQARSHFRYLFPVPDTRRALSFARKEVGAKGLVVVTGSFYLIGEIRKRLHA